MENLNDAPVAPHPALQDALFLYATGSDGAGAILLRGWAELVAKVEAEVACGPDDRWRDILADLDEWSNDGNGNPHHYSVNFEDGFMAIYTVHAEPARQPLTPEKILECVRATGMVTPMGLTRDVGPYSITEPTYYLTRLIAAVERAHGIVPKG